MLIKSNGAFYELTAIKDRHTTTFSAGCMTATWLNSTIKFGLETKNLPYSRYSNCNNFLLIFLPDKVIQFVALGTSESTMISLADFISLITPKPAIQNFAVGWHGAGPSMHYHPKGPGVALFAGTLDWLTPENLKALKAFKEKQATDSTICTSLNPDGTIKLGWLAPKDKAHLVPLPE